MGVGGGLGLREGGFGEGEGSGWEDYGVLESERVAFISFFSVFSSFSAVEDILLTSTLQM